MVCRCASVGQVPALRFETLASLMKSRYITNLCISMILGHRKGLGVDWDRVVIDASWNLARTAR